MTLPWNFVILPNISKSTADHVPKSTSAFGLGRVGESNVSMNCDLREGTRALGWSAPTFHRYLSPGKNHFFFRLSTRYTSHERLLIVGHLTSADEIDPGLHACSAKGTLKRTTPCFRYCRIFSRLPETGRAESVSLDSRGKFEASRALMKNHA